MKNSKQRLETAKAKAASWIESHGSDCHYSNWRNVRSLPFPHSTGTWKQDYTGPKSDRPYFCDSWPEWRDLGDAHEVTGIDHTGWFSDSFQDGLIKGRVLQLPSRDGSPIYVPGTYCTEWDVVTIYPLDQYEDKERAARVADGYAEREAEEAREYSAKDQAEQQIEERHEQAKAAIREFHTLAATIKGKTYDLPVCDLVRRELRSLRATVTASVTRIKALKDDHWLAVDFD